MTSAGQFVNNATPGAGVTPAAPHPSISKIFCGSLEFRKYGSSISITHWYTGNEVPANVHTLGFSGAAMTSSNPAAELVLLVTGYRVSQAIHVAATLGIADIIKDGAASASDLAVATNSHAGALYRVLRALAAAGVFHEDDKKRFSLTPLGECLRSDAERPMAAWASFIGVLISGRPGARFRTVCGPARTPTATSMALASGITSSNILRKR